MTEQTASTSQAAREVAQSDEPWAAVGSAIAGHALRPRADRRATSRTTRTTPRASSSSGARRSRRRRARPHDDRLLPGRRPAGLALRDPRAFRRARHQPHQTRESPDQAGPRRLLLRHRVRGPRRRRRRRRLPGRPAGPLGPREVPRLVPDRRGASERPRAQVTKARHEADEWIADIRSRLALEH